MHINIGLLWRQMTSRWGTKCATVLRRLPVQCANDLLALQNNV